MPDMLRIPRIELPDDWMPEGTVCALVPIPDDPQFLAALVGLIDQLRYSRNFARDATATGAAIVARTWDSALATGPIVTVDCEGAMTVFDVRQNEENPCILEKSTDGGETWTEWADLSLCPPTVMLGSDGKTIIYWCPTCGPGGTPGWTELPSPDPEYNPAYDDPQTPYDDWITPGQDPACVWAANAAEGFKSVYERIGYGLLIGSLTTVIWTEAVFQLFTSKTLPKKARDILALLTGASVYTSEDWNDDLDTFDWQEMIDLLCCFYSDDGTVTQADYEAGQAAMASKTGPLWDMTKAIINLVGINGMNNAAVYAGLTEADCDCTCDAVLSTCWELRDDDYDFIAVSGKGIWIEDVGWKGQLFGGTNYILDMTCTSGIPAGTIDQMRVDWTPTGNGKIMRCYIDGVLKREIYGGSAGARSTTFAVNEAVSSIRIYLEQNTLNDFLRATRVCFYRS